MADRPPTLSNRGQTRLVKISTPGRYSIPVGTKFYDRELNPSGLISVATAENSLLTRELLEYINSHFELESRHLKYRPSIINGSRPSTIEAVPKYINEVSHPISPVLPSQTVVGPGLGALIAQFVWAVCNPGEGVIMTTPYYDDYRRDIEYHAQAELVPAHIPPNADPLGLDAINYLRDTINESNRNGTLIKVLLLCNPHNPVGSAYPQETILAYASLAEEYDLHLLVDEVFAIDPFPTSFVPNPPPFISILSLDLSALAGCSPSRVHLLAGPTKAFGASGIKVGAFVSQHNPDMVKMMTAALYPTPISSAADAIFTAVLKDDKFSVWFLQENRIRLAAAFERAGRWCVFHKIPFTPVSTGVFFLLDLAPVLNRRYPDAVSVDDKLEMAVASMLQAGVFMRPTTASQDPIATRFRMTFTLEVDVMILALKRLEKALGLAEFQF